MTSSTIQDAINETDAQFNDDPQEVLKNNLKSQINYTGHAAGLTTEVATGLALDAKTAPWLAGGPVGWAAYIAANAAGGATANIAAQKLRGEEELNWGEVLSSGLLGIIPFTSLRFGKKATKLIGRPGTFKRAVTGGAGIGASDRFIQSGFNEGELPSAGEVATGAITGGVFGGGLQQGGKFVVTKNVQKQIFKAQQEGRTEDLGELIFKLAKARNDETVEGFHTFKQYQAYKAKNLRLQDNLIDQIDGTSDHIRRNDLGEVVQHPDLVKPVSRQKAAEVSGMGQEGGGGGPLDFRNLTTEAQQELARKVPQDAERITLTAGNPYSPHHVWPLKTMPAAVDYLDDEGMTMSLRFLRDRLGDVKFGDVQKPYMAYGALHDKLHDFMRLELGDNWNLVKVLEVKHFDGKRLSDGIGIQERMKPGGFYEDVVKVLKEQERIIKTFQTALEGQSDWLASTPTEFVDRVISKANLNEEFKEITRRLIERSTSANPKGGRAPDADVKQIIDEIIGEALSEDLRSAVIQRNDEISKILDNQPSNPAKLVKAERAINYQLRKFISETKAYYTTPNIRRNRVRDFVDEYKIFEYGFTDDQMDDLINGLITHVDDHGVETLPPTTESEIRRWMGWN